MRVYIYMCVCVLLHVFLCMRLHLIDSSAISSILSHCTKINIPFVQLEGKMFQLFRE
jgi:glycerol-3-phosphate responsive antiterminator